MQLQHYLTEGEKQYHLRLKTVMPLDDAMMDRIETCVAKYNPLTISSPKKTVLQRVPLDFPNVTNAEVYIVDMSFGLPAAPHVLRADIRKVLDAPENFVFVRTRNEPGETETQRLNALADIEVEADRRGLRPAPLLLDPTYGEGMHDNPELFGMDYNAALLQYLSTVEGERRKTVAKAANVPFQWLPLSDHKNYNENVKDAPFVTWKSKSKPPVAQSMLGDIDQSQGQVRRTYLDADGKRVVLTRALAGANQ